MTEKVSMVMATQVAMDVAPATRSIRSLNANLNILTRSSKAQAANFRAAGDALNASKAEYEGFSIVLGHSKNLLSDLVKQQTNLIRTAQNQDEVVSQLKDKIASLQQERQQEDRSTDESKEKWRELTEQIKAYQKSLRDAENVDTRLNTVNRQINSTTSRIAAMTKAQEKAKQEYNDQRSGLTDLQASYRLTAESSRAYTDRLRAEGNASLARRSELSSLRELRGNLTQQLAKQREALSKLSETEDKDSESMVRQRMAINETRTKIAETTNSIDRLNTSGRGLHVFSSFRQGLHDVDNDASNTEQRLGHLHGVFLGTFAGNIVSNATMTAFGAVKAGIGGLITAGMKYNNMEQTMTASWNTLTGSAQKGAEMQDMINGLAQKAQNSIPMVDQLAQKMYAVTNSKDQTRDLTKSILTLQDAFHVDDAAIQNFGLQWSQMIGNGKASAQDMLSVQTVFPKFREELLAYERQVTGNANLTMQQMNDLMSKGKISSQAMNTVLINMAQQYKGATQNFASTTDGMRRTIQAMWPKLAGDATKALNTFQSPVYSAVSKWVSDTRTDALFKQFGSRVGESISQIFISFAGNNPQEKIPAMLNKMVTSASNGLRSFTTFIQQHVKQIKDVLSIIGSSFQLVGNVGRQVFTDLINIIGGFLNSGNKSASFASNLNRVAQAMKSLSNNQAVIKTLSRTLITFFAVKGALGFISTTLRVIDTINRFAKTVGRVMQVVRSAFNLVKLLAVTNPAIAITAGIVAVITALVELYRHNAKFRNFVNGLVRSAQQFGARISRGMRNLGNGIRVFFTQTIPNIFRGAARAMIVAVKFITNPIGTSLGLLYRNSPQFRKFTNGLVTDMRNGAKGVGNWLSHMGKGFLNFFTKTIPNTVRSAQRAIHDAIIDVIKFIEKPINSFFHDAVSGVNKVAEKAHLPKLGEIHLGIPSFATGTGTDQDQMAIVNDATSGPYREAMVYNNKISLFPEGRNLLRFIPKGAQILNGKNTQELINRLPHFADGVGQVNTLVSGLQQNGNMLHEAERKIFWQKIQQQLQKLLKEFKKDLQKATRQLHKAIQDAKKEFSKTVYGDGEDGGIVGQRKDSMREANSTYVSSKNEAQNKLNDSLKDAKDSNAVQNAYNAFNNAIQKASSARSQSLQKANQTFHIAYENAAARENTAVTNAENVYDAARDAYLHNRGGAYRWAAKNREQFMSGLPQFATGGIATSPSIFGEAGPEMAIPLTDDPANAMELMGQVADNYRSGTIRQSSPNAELERHNRAQEAKLDKLCGLLAQVLEGQSQQTGVIASKPGYDKNTAYNDLASALTNEQFGALTV